MYLVAILREGETSNLKPAPNNKKDIKTNYYVPYIFLKELNWNHLSLETSAYQVLK